MAKHNAVSDSFRKEVVAYYVAHQDLTDGEIGKKFDIHRSTVTRWANSAGYRRKPRIDDVDWTEIDPLFLTHTISQIMKLTGLTRYVIGNRRASLNLGPPRPPELIAPIAGPHVKLWDGWKRPKGMLEYINAIRQEKNDA